MFDSSAPTTSAGVVTDTGKIKAALSQFQHDLASTWERDAFRGRSPVLASYRECPTSRA
jgi:hypothetical protein